MIAKLLTKLAQALRTAGALPLPKLGFRPELETLEDRTLLSTFEWIGGADQPFWTKPTNWLVDGNTNKDTKFLPRNGDDVIFNNKGANALLSVVDPDILGQVNSLKILDWQKADGKGGSKSGTLRLDRSLTIVGKGAQSEMDTGTIAHGVSDLTFGQGTQFVWHGGKLKGGGDTVVKAGAVLDIQKKTGHRRKFWPQ